MRNSPVFREGQPGVGRWSGRGSVSEGPQRYRPLRYDVNGVHLLWYHLSSRCVTFLKSERWIVYQILQYILCLSNISFIK